MDILVKGAYLIDGTGAPPIHNGAVLVKDGMIAAVGPARAIHLPTSTAIVDCEDNTLLPGLINAHTHATLNPKRQTPMMEQGKADVATMALRAAHNLLLDLLSGVTFQRGLGEPAPFVDIALRNAIADGEIPGPTLLAAGRAFRPSHGTGSPIGWDCDGADALRKAVRENVAAGVDWIKLIITNTRYGETLDGFWRGDLVPISAYSRDEIRVAIDEAHNAGLKVAVHALGGAAMRWALECGVDSVEHANLMEHEDIERFLTSGAWISTPNLHLFFDPDSAFADGAPGCPSPDWWKTRVEKARENTRDMISAAMKAGVRIALGSDTLHGELWREAKMLTLLGAGNLDAIVACTKAGAELCDCADSRGTLSVGKAADIISTRGNPAEDIDSLGNVNLVMKSGKVYAGPQPV